MGGTRLVSVAVVMAALVAGSPAYAQTVPGKSAAKELFEEGVALEKKGDWAAAAARFDDAAKILATPGVRYHQGYTYEMRGLIATALDHYESAVSLAKEQKKPEVEKAATTRLEPLRGKVPMLAMRLVTRADGAKVRLDGKEIAAPLLEGKAFRVDPGEHTVTASAAGYRDFSAKVTNRESTTTPLDVTLEKVGSAPAPVPAPAPAPAVAPTPPPTASSPSPSPAPAPVDVQEPPKEEPRKKAIVVPLVVTGGAVAFAATGLVTFLLAGSAQSDGQQACPTKVSCDDERSKVRTLDTVALVGFAGGAALGAAAIVLWTTRGSGTTGLSAPGARVVATPGGARLEGAFW